MDVYGQERREKRDGEFHEVMESPFSSASMTAGGLQGLVQMVEQDRSPSVQDSQRSKTAPRSYSYAGPQELTVSGGAEAYVQRLIMEQRQELESLRGGGSGGGIRIPVAPASISTSVRSQSTSARSSPHRRWVPPEISADNLSLSNSSTMERMQAELESLRHTTETLQKHHAHALSEKDQACATQIQKMEDDCARTEMESAQKMSAQVEQATAQRRLDGEANNIRMQELDSQWKLRYETLDSKYEEQVLAHQILQDENEKLKERLATVQRESTAMLHVYEGALETALSVLAEEREAAAADNRGIRDEVLHTITQLSDKGYSAH